MAARRKTGTQTALTSNYAAAQLGARMRWALVDRLDRRLNAQEMDKKMTTGTPLDYFTLMPVLLIEHIWSDGRRMVCHN